jgi:signal-transduction protein with cAMP-binding, CBS, and nucleotidyltransferase domain
MAENVPAELQTSINRQVLDHLGVLSYAEFGNEWVSFTLFRDD